MHIKSGPLRNFRDNESGGITIFVILLFLIMVVGGGMAVDFMRQETMRADLQNALDRGVLAAASFKQGNDPEQIVQDYLDSRSFRDYTYDLNVNSQLSLNSRLVTADASVRINTFFLKIIGINQLSAVAHGVAKEAITNVEISLVLDVSGSMGRNGKMTKLQNAAREFVDTVLTDTTRDKTTISVVPYSAQVNPGAALASKYNVNIWQNYDYCLAIPASDYYTTELLPTTQYDQEQHWRWRSCHYWCPTSDRQILPFSNNNTELKDMISDLYGQGNTSSYMGMKWGVALLDPETQPVVAGLIGEGVVDPSFANRPGPYADPSAPNSDDTLKVVILMTDGVNTTHKRVKDWYYDRHSPAYWHNRSISYNSNKLETVVNWREGDRRLDHICTAAKDAGIVIYTIGFEVAGTAAEGKMRNCATSPNNAFLVEGVEISDAFRVIANDIDQLKLIQ